MLFPRGALALPLFERRFLPQEVKTGIYVGDKEFFMKKMIFCVIPILMVLAGCLSGGTAAAGTGGGSAGMDLDAAIKEAAARMEAKLPGGTKVALVSLASSSAQLSEYVIGRLEAALVDGGTLVVVDRANLDKVRAEQGFQLSGEVDDDSAKSIGKLLGAGAIVTGAFADLGDVYSLSLKAINIETATVAVSYPADVAKSIRIETMLASGGGAAGTRTAQAGGSAAPATPAAPAYKIGDTGPAGGLVFYDKGGNSGGWRYLEAAPASTEARLKVLTRYGEIGGTKTEVGTGKQNTQLHTADFSKGVPEAALHCVELEHEGFQDWFLPSKDELNLMYINLKRKNLGGFGNDWYWSSSEYQSVWARAQRFSDGSQANERQKTETGLVRAIRQF
jgi:hypothetical protein